MDAKGMPYLKYQPSSRTGENPPYGMKGQRIRRGPCQQIGMEPTSACGLRFVTCKSVPLQTTAA